MRLWIFTLILASSSLPAFGQSSCWPREAAGFTATIDPSQSGEQFAENLRSANGDTVVITQAQIAGKVSSDSNGQAILHLTARFNPDFNGVSLPYTVYAVRVTSGDQEVLFRDFSKNCRGAGVSFYPGTLVPSGKILLPPGLLSNLTITVWGRM